MQSPTARLCILQLLASIFQQLGGPGHVAGFVGGEGGNASGQRVADRPWPVLVGARKLE